MPKNEKQGLKNEPYVYKPNRNLFMIKDPLKYEVTRIQILVRVLNRQLIENPLKVNIQSYLELLETHTKKLTELKKLRKVADDEERVVEEVPFGEEEGATGEEVPASVDTGVSAKDTFTS